MTKEQFKELTGMDLTDETINFVNYLTEGQDLSDTEIANAFNFKYLNNLDEMYLKLKKYAKAFKHAQISIFEVATWFVFISLVEDYIEARFGHDLRSDGLAYSITFRKQDDITYPDVIDVAGLRIPLYPD